MTTTGGATVTRLQSPGTAPGAARLDFSILGPLQVAADDRAVPLGSAKERVLLLRLLLSPRRVVAVDVLIEDLWGATPSEPAAANLRVYVSRLRKRLRDISGHELLVTRSPGYVLEIDPTAIDAVRCETAAEWVRHLLSAGAYEAAATAAREALAAWRGPVLGEAGAYLFAQPEAARLDELQRTLVEDRIEADLARGLDAELVGELSVLVDRHPYRERLWGQLMLALYRAGHQVEAPRAYERFRPTLAEGLGVRPMGGLDPAATQLQPDGNATR
ncbi:MAG: hypothetical protein NVSMB12_18570 [Acidimicrobiales bacterium]